MRTSTLAVLVSLALCGCASSPQRVEFVPENEFELSVAAAPGRQVFELGLTSKSDEAICLDVDQWPNTLGQVHMGSMRAQVIAASRTFPAADQNFGYCVGERCVIRIEPHQRISGFVAFSEFQGWDQNLSGAQLRYTVRPWFCGTGAARGGAASLGHDAQHL
jgi:hypothetical protein